MVTISIRLEESELKQVEEAIKREREATGYNLSRNDMIVKWIRERLKRGD